MYDINKQITNPGVSPEVLDHRLELPEWNRDIALGLAKQEEIEMTDAHWRVVEFLRAHHLKYGPAEKGRDLATALDGAFADEGGGRYLHELFPKGPVAQGSRIAGLPVPPYTESAGFGSAM